MLVQMRVASQAAEEVDESVKVLVISGDVDVVSAPLLGANLDQRYLDGHHHTVIDLREVGFIDASGLGTIVGRMRRAELAGGFVRIVSGSMRLRRLLRLAGLESTVPVFASVEAALQAR